jgi:hypothetical protein
MAMVFDPQPPQAPHVGGGRPQNLKNNQPKNSCTERTLGRICLPVPSSSVASHSACHVGMVGEGTNIARAGMQVSKSATHNLEHELEGVGAINRTNVASMPFESGVFTEETKRMSQHSIRHLRLELEPRLRLRRLSSNQATVARGSRLYIRNPVPCFVLLDGTASRDTCHCHSAFFRISCALAWELGSGPHPQGAVAILHISLRNTLPGLHVPGLNVPRLPTQSRTARNHLARLQLAPTCVCGRRRRGNGEEQGRGHTGRSAR